MDQCVITRQITVAAGVFAPGHLGELTQIVPFEMVDQALAATGTTQARIRVLPARVVVYLLLAGGLFAGLGYRQVWHKLTAGLGSLPVVDPGDRHRLVGLVTRDSVFTTLRQRRKALGADAGSGL